MFADAACGHKHDCGEIHTDIHTYMQTSNGSRTGRVRNKVGGIRKWVEQHTSNNQEETIVAVQTRVKEGNQVKTETDMRKK